MIKILVIEDEQTIRDNISEILNAEDYDVITAENGLTGVIQAIKQSPDLIISDVTMPELDGYGVISALRKNPRTKYIPLIFLTARTECSHSLLGKSLGASFYLAKPFSRQDLLKVIAGTLQQLI